MAMKCVPTIMTPHYTESVCVPIPTAKGKDMPLLPKMIKVTSTGMNSIGYDAASKVLYVVFVEGKDVYTYRNVPPQIWDLLVAAAGAPEHISIGSMFNYLIKIHKEKYSFTKQPVG